MYELPDSTLDRWYKEAADAGGLRHNYKIISLVRALKEAREEIADQAASIGKYVMERGRMRGVLERTIMEHFNGTYPTDDIIKEWMNLAQTRLDEGHPADPAALSTIITLCELVLDMRHPKPVFQNLLHQGNPE